MKHRKQKEIEIKRLMGQAVKRFYLFTFLSLTTISAAEPASETAPAGAVPASAPISAGEDSGVHLLLSQNIEERVKEALEPILANQKYSVSARVWTKQEKREVKPSAEERQMVEEEEELLPGIPRLKIPAGDKRLDPSIVKIISKTSIQKIALKIFVDEMSADSLIESAKKIASSAASLDFSRGDEIVIEKIAFPKEAKVKKMWVSDFLLNPKYLWIAVGAGLGLLFLIFLFGPARTLAKSYIAAMQLAAATKTEPAPLRGEAPSEARGKNEGETKESALETAELEMEEALARASSEISQALATPSALPKVEGNGHHPFSFVTEKSLPNFMHLILKETPSAIAVAVHYLEPSVGAQVLSELPIDLRAQVIQQLSQVQEREPKDVQSLEAKVQARLHYVVGGEDKLRDLVSFAEPELQPALLSAIRSVNSALAEKVQKSMASIESLAQVEPAVLQAVIRQMGMKNFCPLMLSLTEPLREKIVTKLPGGLAQRVKEEIDLSRPLPPTRFKEERNRLIGILRKLQQEGILQ